MKKTILLLSSLFISFLCFPQSDSLQNEFMDAIRWNELDKIQNYIDRGGDVNFFDEDGETPLLRAVLYGNLKAVKLLVKNNANINEFNSEGKGFKYEKRGISTLISNSFQNENALMRAASNNYYEIFEYLIIAGADVNIKIPRSLNGDNRPKYSVLDASRNNYKMLKFLIDEKGMSIEEYIDRDGGFSFLAEAAGADNMEYLTYVINLGGSIDAKETVNETPLVNWVAHNASPTMLREIISLGADLNQVNSSKQTILMSAVGSGNVDNVKIVLTHFNNIEATDQYGRTALSHAAERGNLDIVKFLVNSGANVNNVDKKGYSVIAMAAGSQRDFDPTAKDYSFHRGKLDMVKYLITQGANINQLSNNGENLIHYAAYKGNLELIKYLAEDLGMKLKITASGGAYKGLNALGYAEKQLAHYGSDANNDEYAKVIKYLKLK